MTTLLRAGGIAVSPSINSRDVVIVGIGLGGAPYLGIFKKSTACVGDAFVIEGKDTLRARGRA